MDLLNTASTELGEGSAVMDGMIGMPEWCVANLDLTQEVKYLMMKRPECIVCW